MVKHAAWEAYIPDLLLAAMFQRVLYAICGADRVLRQSTK